MRDEFSPKIKRITGERAGYLCSRPSCRALTIGPQYKPESSANVGVAAHISAASPGGPRYDDTMTSEERMSEKNGIWLCQTCAKLIDNDVIRFPVSILKKWKTDAEEEARINIGKPAKQSFNERMLLDRRFELVVEDYKRRGTPKFMIDTFDDLDDEKKAELFDRAIRLKRGKLPKSNPYRKGD